MDRLIMVWCDLTVSLREADSSPLFDEKCVRKHAEPEELDSLIQRDLPDALCLEFDYPHRSGLRLLREIKTAYPSMPIIMLTVQHSEALAVWAFRTGVWDYLVKPVPKAEVERCLLTLFRAAQMRRAQPHRSPTSRGTRIPEEIAHAPKAANTSLAAALSYVEKNFRSKVRCEDVAALCGLSPFRFSRAFKDAFGITFRDYLVGYRVKEACRLLENPTTSVTDVAFAVGFNDASYFTRVFKQRTGVAPSSVVGQDLEHIAGIDISIQLPSLPDLVH
jgi:YesN/AraC family two-component response regulator